MYNADINARDSRGNTPLHLACQTGDLDIILTLMRYNPTLIYNENGYSPLHTSAKGNHVSIVDTLKTKFGWDVNLVNTV